VDCSLYEVSPKPVRLPESLCAIAPSAVMTHSLPVSSSLFNLIIKDIAMFINELLEKRVLLNFRYPQKHPRWLLIKWDEEKQHVLMMIMIAL